ncbi:DNA repair protein RAD50 [Thraustotheca clavata]|uniref:DNA repair protein RAD50 n=1 Tax=Thraustotheca clavata TaxID=74557 RepID=A0A1V9ZZA5_9STRA|nr:DNA repair protein RAD50 [Thraustotheca clavata]
MSSIEKLSIRGIRSFYPGRDETIDFNQPLTVILGANGCGKTTIIECLKVSCTGSLPPSARSGQSFIHDPKIRGDVEVKASVRLRFKSRAGQTMVVQRTFRLQQMKTNCKFQAMDGVVRMINEHGEKVSINQKCSELDKHIPDLLGVSKAVLESVIFCHQEESNWPLQEGAVLKKRFDDIFESARYTKALEAIKKLKKDRLTMAKDMKRDLDVIGEQVKRVRDMESQLEARQAKLEELKDEFALMSGEIDQLQKAAEDTEKELERIRAVHAQLREQQSIVKQKADEIERVYRQMGREMIESTESLEEILANYDSILAIKQKEVQELQAKEAQLNEELVNLDRRERQLVHEKGVLEATMNQQKEALRTRADLASEIGSQYGITTFSAVASAVEVRVFWGRLQEVVAQNEAKVKELEVNFRKSDDEWSTKLTAISAKVHHCNETLQTKARELAMMKRKEETLLIELNKAGGSMDTASSQRESSLAEARLTEAEAKLAAARESNAAISLKQDILNVEREDNEIAFDLRAIEDQITILRTFERDEIALEHKRNEHEGQTKSLKDALSNIAIVTLQKAPAIETLNEDRTKLEASVFDLKRKMDESHSKYKGLECSMAEAQVKKRTDEQSVTKLRQKLDKLNTDKLVEWKQLLTQHELTPDSALSKLENLYLEAKDKTQSRKNTILFLRTYMKKGQNDHACPLCQRGLTQEEETLFTQLIREKMDDAKNQEKIIKAEQNEKAAFETWKRCEALFPLHIEATRLDEELQRKVPDLEAQYQSIRNLETQLQEAKMEFENLQTRHKEATQTLQQLTSLQSKQEDLVINARRLKDDEDHLTSERAVRLGGNPPTLAFAQTRRDAKQHALQECQTKLKRLQRELQMIQENQQVLQNEVHKYREEKSQINQRQADREKAREARDQLRGQIKTLQDEIATYQRDLPALQRDLQQSKNEQLLSRETAQRSMASARETLSKSSNDRRRYEEKNKQVEKFALQNLSGQANELAGQLQTLACLKSEKKQSVEQIQPEKSMAMRALDENINLKRQIEDNLAFRRLQQEVENAKQRVAETTQMLSQYMSIQEAENVVKQAKEKLNRTKENRAVFTGKQQQLQEMVREIQVQLQSREYKNIDEKQRHKLIDYETTMMAVSDLDKYYKALDISLMEYHSKKIEEINAIIRNLWQITYRGQDIDTIELVSGQETGAKSGRSYNYRVVMRKDNTVLDMRGRCSAGQKVLAGLVIRLALAETFCLNCGILALDEPTTNLDSANKLGLAQAISDILKARENQHNFQLICITHDEEFVQMLNRSQLMGGNRPEFFWTVSREELAPRYYCSKIEKKNWSSDFVYCPVNDI